MPRSPIPLDDYIEMLSKQTHSGTALVLSARLEQALFWILEGHMPNLSNTLRDKIFKGYGPLSNFRSKIDIAYALDLISEYEKQCLHAVRDIRNEFAHSDEPDMHFDHSSITALIPKIPHSKNGKEDNHLSFLACVSEMADSLQDHLKGQFNVRSGRAISPDKDEPSTGK